MPEEAAPKFHQQFCDRDGARHPDDHPTEAGNPVGCGAPLPEGVYSDSWLEQADENAPVVRVHGRFAPGGHICERCDTTYHPNVGERMKAVAAENA